MYYVITDIHGDDLDRFEDFDEAAAALGELVEDDPDARDGVLLLRYNDDGEVEGPALTYDDALRLEIERGSWAEFSYSTQSSTEAPFATSAA